MALEADRAPLSLADAIKEITPDDEAHEELATDEVVDVEVVEELETEADEAPPEPAITAPISWTAEDRERFAELPPEMQQTIVTRESAREATLTQQKQELAAEQERIASESEELSKSKERLAEQLDTYKVQAPERPSAKMLDPESESYDPDLYHREVAAYEAALERQTEAQKERDELTKEDQSRQQEVLTNFVQNRNVSLKKAAPEFFAKDGDKLLGGLETYIRSYDGYKDADLTYLDTDALMIAYKAQQFDAAQKGEKVRTSSKTVRQQAPRSKVQVDQAKVKQLQERADKGDHDAVVQLLQTPETKRS